LGIHDWQFGNKKKLDIHKMDSLAQQIQKSKKRLLQMHYESGVGHIGGNLSCLDSLMVLYHEVLKKDDLFILSKGHAAGALYIVLWSMGRLGDEDLKLFHKEHTKLSGHPAPDWLKEITFATGSLGHGFPLASGLSLGKKLQGQSGRVFCLTSDGEWEEGSNWEALLFAVHHKLESLTVMVDWNGLQGFGTTKEVAGLDDLKKKFLSFGMPTEEIDGHDLKALREAWQSGAKGPRAVIAHTEKGRGVSFMRNKMEWHYLPLTEAQYHQAMGEMEKT
jgi:transketolase